MRLKQLLPASVILLLITACDKDNDESPETFRANGDISFTINNFRQALGELNTGSATTTGRREITWEAVPDEMLDKTLPGQFFNQTNDDANPALQKGIVYDPEFDFRVSKTQFSSLDPEASTEFSAFSGSAVFASVNEQPQPWPLAFQVAGENQTAAVRGFGMVVNDVDLEGSVSIQYFNGNSLIGSVDVPARTPENPFSFAGLLFKEPVITSIRVKHQGILKAGEKDISQGGQHDLVVVDDFIYSEPIKN